MPVGIVTSVLASKLIAALPLCLLASLCAQSDVDPAVGIWQGTPRTLLFELHLAVHVAPGDNGAVDATVEVLDEDDAGIQVTGFERTQDTVAFAVQALGARFEGRLVDGEPRRLVGHWFAGTGRVPVVFESVAAVRRPARRQHPTGELPYDTHDIAFSHVPIRGLDESFRPNANAAQGAITLAGTLSRPRGAGPFPGVLLIAGSGYQTRDATNRGHRPFLVLADRLTRRGFAVLRYDKRGCGYSTGTLRGATSADLAIDARAALRYLHARAEVDPSRVGIVGHSEGAMIAPIVASGPDAAMVAGVVSLAPPGARGADMIIHQIRLYATTHGMAATDVSALVQLRIRLFELLSEFDQPAQWNAAMQTAAERCWAELSESGRRSLGDWSDNLIAWATRMNDPWVRYIADHDPAPAFGRCGPILVVFGSKDLQTAPALNLPPIRAALAGVEDATIRLLPGLNHLLQQCATGAPGEYFDIEQTIADEALDAVTSWLAERLGR